MSLRDWFHAARTTGTAGIRVAIPITLLALLGFYITWHFIEPAPPTKIVMAAGLPGGAYDRFAHEYAKFFKDNGFELEVKPTAGAIENYRLLLDPNSGVDMAIVQGGTMPPEAPGHLQAICSVYFEPLWVFYRSDTPITLLSQLAGHRIAIGKPGSGVRALASGLLSENGIIVEAPASTVFSDLTGQEAADALKAGQLDAIFLVIAPESAVVWNLVHTPGIRMMNFDQADAYAHRFPFLSSVKLYQGVIDLGQDIPSRDLELIAPAASLVTRKQAHHATIELLVQAAKAAHSGGTTLSSPDQFPSAQFTDLPVSSDAQYYLRTPPSRFLGRLPFWLKSLVDRLLVLLIPLLALLLPLVRFAPALFRWSVRSRVVRYYTRLRRVEEHLETGAPRFQLEEDLKSLDSLSHKLATMAVPAGFMPDLYDLRTHLERLRDRLKSHLNTRAEVRPT